MLFLGPGLHSNLCGEERGQAVERAIELDSVRLPDYCMCSTVLQEVYCMCCNMHYSLGLQVPSKEGGTRVGVDGPKTS